MVKKLLLSVMGFVKAKPLASLACLFVLAGVGGFAMHKVEGVPSLACSPCHVMEPYVEGYQSGELLAHRHEQADITCIECHENGMEDKINETVWYITDDFDDPPLKRDFGNEMCTKCHDDLDKIIHKTDYGEINPHSSHLGTLVCSDCHLMHEKSRASCADCHNNFEFLAKLPPEWDKEPK